MYATSKFAPYQLFEISIVYHRHSGRSDPSMDGGIVHDGYISPELQKLNPSPEDY